MKLICISFPASSSSSTTVSDEACQSNSHETTAKARQFIIELPGDIEISPAVLFRHLAEKFSNSSNHKNNDTPSNYLIRSKQSHPTLPHIVSITDSSNHKSHFIHSINSFHSSSDVRYLFLFAYKKAYMFHIYTLADA